MSDLPTLNQTGYMVQSIEFRDGMVVVNFTEPDQLKGPVQDHTSRVILYGADEELDAKINETMEDVQELLNMAHVVRRRPPDTRPARGA